MKDFDIKQKIQEQLGLLLDCKDETELQLIQRKVETLINASRCIARDLNNA